MVVEVVVVKAKVGVTSNKRKVAEVVAELVVVELVLVGAKILMVVEVIPVVAEHLQVENIHRKILAVVVTAVRLVVVVRKALLHQPVQHQYHSDSAVFPALPIILKVDTDCIRLRMII